MKAGEATIYDIFKSSSLLRIPYFQRRYRWGEEKWQRFADDMLATIQSERKYFLGALILKEEGVSIEEKRRGVYEKYLVIDGQQRLTTMAIFMKILHHKAGKIGKFTYQFLQDNELHEPILIHSVDDKLKFRSIMTLNSLIELETDSKIAKAYMFFLNYLKNKEDEGVSMSELLNDVTTTVNFVTISLTQEDDEQQIFDTINSIGEPLTTGDLVKNFLYRGNDENLYKETWYKVFDTDENKDFWDEDASKTSQAKTPENKRIEKFLHAYVRMKMWYFKEQFREHDRKDFVKTKNVFNTIKTFVNEFGAERIEIANEIVEYAKLYKKYLSSDILDIRVPQHFGIKRLSCLLNATKKDTPIPYILYILKNVNEESERNLIFGLIETYLVRRMLAESSSLDKSYSEFFTEQLIGQEKDSYEKLKEYIHDRDGSNLAMPSDTKIKIRQGVKKVDEITARIIYYLFETRLVPTDAMTFNNGFNSYYAEQLMPKPGRDADPYWQPLPQQEEEDERARLTGTLGNYFLLDDIEVKELKKVHNLPLAQKRPTMLRWVHNVRSSETTLNQTNSWDKSNIETRNNAYAEKFCNDIWPIINND